MPALKNNDVYYNLKFLNTKKSIKTLKSRGFKV